MVTYFEMGTNKKTSLHTLEKVPSPTYRTPKKVGQAYIKLFVQSAASALKRI